MKKYKLGIIGVGVMGQSILHCAIEKKVLQKEQIALFDVSKSQLEAFQDSFTCLDSARELLNLCEYVLVSIKPQHFGDLLQQATIPDDVILLSIMAGITIQSIRRQTDSTCGITRIMPNTPCRLGYGMCALCFDQVNNDQKVFVKSLFASCGKTIELEETFFDAVTSVSGSGPAYVYSFIDGMIKGGMEGGLTYEQSKILTLQTFLGTVKMVENSDEPLETLINKVCSKGGTTIEAIRTFRDHQLEQIIIEGMNACRNRSKELSKANETR